MFDLEEVLIEDVFEFPNTDNGGDNGLHEHFVVVFECYFDCLIVDEDLDEISQRIERRAGVEILHEELLCGDELFIIEGGIHFQLVVKILEHDRKNVNVFFFFFFFFVDGLLIALFLCQSEVFRTLLMHHRKTR